MPCSSYSLFSIHIISKLSRLVKTLPPIQQRFCRSSLATVFTIQSSGTIFSISAWNLSTKLGIIVPPPEKLTVPHNSGLKSISARCMHSNAKWCSPGISLQSSFGSNKSSGAIRHCPFSLKTEPSGNLYSSYLQDF